MGDEGSRAARFLVGLSAGSRIAGYRLEEQIGEGGMAVVFRARDERLQRQVALKVLAPTLVADEEFRRRFIRESGQRRQWMIRTLSRCSKPAMRTGCCSSPCGMCLAVM